MHLFTKNPSAELGSNPLNELSECQRSGELDAAFDCRTRQSFRSPVRSAGSCPCRRSGDRTAALLASLVQTARISPQVHRSSNRILGLFGRVANVAGKIGRIRSSTKMERRDPPPAFMQEQVSLRRRCNAWRRRTGSPRPAELRSERLLIRPVTIQPGRVPHTQFDGQLLGNNCSPVLWRTNRADLNYDR